MTRRTARADVTARLTAATGVGGLLEGVEVYNARVDPIPERIPKALSVDVPRDRLEAKTTGAPHWKELVELHVECHASGDSDLEAADNADLLEEAVREVLFADPTFVTQYEGFPRIEAATSAASAQSVRRAVVDLLIELQRTVAYEPDPATLDDLLGITTEVDLAPPDGQIEAGQRIELEPPE